MIARQEYFVNNYFAEMRNILVLVIKQAMAIALEIRIRNLLPELLADALIVLGHLQTAGAVAALGLQTLPDGFYHFLVLIQTYCHNASPLFFSV